MWHVWGRGRYIQGYGGRGNMKTEKRLFQGTRWRLEDNVKLDLKESDWEVMGKLICFSVGARGRLLCMC
jgi:hypothetical protein